MLPKLRPFLPIKEKYNPRPNAAEDRHEQRLYRMPCYGCGRFGVRCHHTLLEFPEKRFKRDHRYQLPLCDDCHTGPRGVHGIGSERKWLASVGKTEAEAIAFMLAAWAYSEQREASRAA